VNFDDIKDTMFQGTYRPENAREMAPQYRSISEIWPTRPIVGQLHVFVCRPVSAGEWRTYFFNFPGDTHFVRVGPTAAPSGTLNDFTSTPRRMPQCRSMTQILEMYLAEGLLALSYVWYYCNH
jgi:hypothetical protein